MDSHSYFERLIASVERIARHAYYPGIEQTINLVLQDVEDLGIAGQISAEQCEALRFILLGMTMNVPSAANAA
ncbi:hypothetical protein OJF2_47140 [Aquisphaera giovannonii]|uniref:Uncharacterized protein n=1 Tax=Aquisphaera giovannonii TaxID=406548 RepID=A0A5B9W7C5_9BACT|nr:hypothetical protein [Aquisphaera giovannonii]QEH36154.1 hypothetical protein OJF2_47140 [Aquisphaera giovannonii]